MHKVLLVEDDDQLREVIGAYLEVSGFSVTSVKTALECWQAVRNEKYSLVVLDLGLPDEDGLVLLRKLKTLNNQLPVIVCSGRGTDDDKIIGLEFGANDYLAKPFKMKELSLRINLLVGDGKSSPSAKHKIQFGDYIIDLECDSLTTANGTVVELTSHEYLILSLLAKHSPRILSREQIIDGTSNLNGPEHNRAVDTAICRLRKKLEADAKNPKHLKTVHGQGYRFLIEN